MLGIPLDFVYMETLLPFLLVVAVVYGGMETAGIFRNRAIKAIVSVVLGFFAVTNYYLVQFVNSVLPYIAIIFLLVFIVGFAKKSLSGSEKDNTMIIIIVVLIMLLTASVANSYGGYGLLQYTEFLWLIGVVFVMAIIFAAYRMKG
jgi:hypothetical protein